MKFNLEFRLMKKKTQNHHYKEKQAPWIETEIEKMKIKSVMVRIRLTFNNTKWLWLFFRWDVIYLGSCAAHPMHFA